MDHKEQQLAVFYVVGLVATVVLVGARFGLGMGLVSQGGIAVAMVMDYYQLGSSELTGAVVTTVLIAVIFNELVSPSLARHVLRTAGEIAP